jgi:hypothetical protein
MLTCGLATLTAAIFDVKYQFHLQVITRHHSIRYSSDMRVCRPYRICHEIIRFVLGLGQIMAYRLTT